MLMNLIKSELYRALKMKSTYILIAVLVLLTLLFSGIMLKVDFMGAYGIDMEQLNSMINSDEEMDQFVEAFQTGMAMGNGFVEDSSPWGKGLMYYSDMPNLFMDTVRSLNSLIVLAIFIGLYFGDINSLSLDKNLILASKKRGILFLSRCIVVALYTLVIHIVAYLATLLSAFLMAESVKFNTDKTAVLYFIITLFITFVFSMLVITVCTVTGSKTAGIVVGVILSTGLITDSLDIADFILKRQFKLESDFSVGNYTLINSLQDISLHTEGKVVIRAITCAVIYFAIFIVTNIIVNKKKDVV